MDISSELPEPQDMTMEDSRFLLAPATPKATNGEDVPEAEEVPVASLEESTDNEATQATLEPLATQESQSQSTQESTQVDETLAADSQTFQHVELHIVDSDEEAADLRVKLLAAPDQNVHLLACARELHVAGIVPTQMDAMAGSTPLFTYVLSTDFMGAAQEIARSLVSGVESAQQQHETEVKQRTRNSVKCATTKADKGLDIYDFDDDGKAKPTLKKRKKAAKRLKKNAVPVADAPEETKKGKKASSQLKCLYCAYSTGKKYLLIRHMRCHSDERPHLCTQEGCGRAFKTTSSLQNHINTHSGVKPHACKYKDCSASFTTSGELVRHSRYKHTHEKPHKCTHEGCGYSSVEMSKLRRHLRSHTGERPFKCPHCDYASPDTYKLKRHLRVHTGEKPYECEICHHKFTQSNSMKAHRMIHEAIKPVFQCSLCPTKCSRKTDLKIHVQKLHQSDQPVVCKKCSKSFADRYLFNVHRKNDVECSGKKSATASPKKRNKKNQKKRGASASSDTTSDEDVPSASEEEDTMMEESQADVEGGFHSVRCVLPDGGVVHIIHNGGTNESDTTRVVALTSAQMAEFQSHSSESQAEAIPPVSLTDNDGGSTQGIRCSLLSVTQPQAVQNGIQNEAFLKILSDVGLKGNDSTLGTAGESEAEPSMSQKHD